MTDNRLPKTGETSQASSSFRESVLFSLSGLTVLGLFMAQKMFVARHDFSVAHHFPDLFKTLQTYALLSGVAFLLVMLATSDIGHIRQKIGLGIILTVFSGLAIMAFFTHPTRSQDIYWSLLMGKAFAQFHLNPYRITTAVLSDDPWAYPVLTWKDLQMMYGPIWTLFVGGIASLAHTLGTAIFLAKASFLASATASGWIFWKIMGHLEFSLARKLQLFALVAWNPFIIQTVLVDMHNDAFLLLTVLASCYFFLRKDFALSAFLLGIGTFIKYTPLLLLPLPCVYLIAEGRRRPLWTACKFVVLALVGLSLLFVLYMPFGGFTREVYTGIQKQFASIGLPTQYLPGTTIVLEVFPMSLNSLYVVGLFLAITAEIVCIAKQKLLLAFTLPFLLIFFFASPWFQPWYVLWILPILALYLTPVAFALLSVFLVLTPELFSPSSTALAFLTGTFVYHFFRFAFLSNDAKLKNRNKFSAEAE